MPGNETTRRLKLVECLVFMAIGAVIGSIITYLVQRPSLPRSNLEYVEVNYGMSKEQIRDMLGQPDDIEIVPPGESATYFDEDDDSTRREVWGYGPFGAYRQSSSGSRNFASHITKYRLLVMFVGDKVVEWTKSAPLDEQSRHP